MREPSETGTTKYLLCSFLAVISSWILNGAYYAFRRWDFWLGLPLKNQIHLVWLNTRSWLVWTGVFCVIGWFLVGLPVVALGERVRKKPVWLVSIIAGIAGAAIMLIPTLYWSVGVGESEALLHAYSWLFCGIAFVIAAVTMIFYRLFLGLANHFAPHKLSG